MGDKNCIYTDKEAKGKDTVLPKKYLDGEPNWANEAPVNIDYKNLKQDKLPTDTEMQLNELSKLRDLYMLRVRWYEAQIAELQKKGEVRKKKVTKVTKKQVNKVKKKKETKKDKEIKQAIQEKEVVESTEEAFEKVLEQNKTSLWD